MNKLPKITFYFWIMKICATTLGETAGDLLLMTLHIGYALSSLILISFFFVTLIAQLGSRKHHPFLYWIGPSFSLPALPEQPCRITWIAPSGSAT